MRIGVTSIVFPYTPLHKSVEEIYKNGFDLIEITAEHLEYYMALNENELKKLNSVKKRYSLTFTVHGPITGFNLGNPVEKIRKRSVQRLHQYIDITHSLGAKILVIHPVNLIPIKLSVYDIPGGTKSIKKVGIISYLHKLESQFKSTLSKISIPRVQQSISEIYEDAESKNVELCFENLYYGLGFDGPDDFEVIFGKNRSNLALTYDPAHDFLAHGKLLPDWFDRFRSKLGHFHAVNTDGVTDSHPSLTLQGKVNFKDLMKKLKNMGYKGYGILENFSIEECKESRNYLEKLM